MPDNNQNDHTAPEIAAQEPAAAASERTTNNKSSDTNNASNNGTGSSRQKQNTFFPGQHGLMIKSIGHRNGQSVDAIQKLYESLAGQFGLEDPIVAMMIELAIVDYWRLGEGHLAEKRLIDSGRYVFDSRGWMPTIVRYNAAARRNLENSLRLLKKQRAEADAKAVETEDGPESDFANGPSAQSDPSSDSTQPDNPSNPASEFPSAA